MDILEQIVKILRNKLYLSLSIPTADFPFWSILCKLTFAQKCTCGGIFRSLRKTFYLKNKDFYGDQTRASQIDR